MLVMFIIIHRFLVKLSFEDHSTFLLSLAVVVQVMFITIKRFLVKLSFEVHSTF